MRNVAHIYMSDKDVRIDVVTKVWFIAIKILKVNISPSFQDWIKTSCLVSLSQTCAIAYILRACACVWIYVYECECMYVWYVYMWGGVCVYACVEHVYDCSVSVCAGVSVYLCAWVRVWCVCVCVYYVCLCCAYIRVWRAYLRENYVFFLIIYFIFGVVVVLLWFMRFFPSLERREGERLFSFVYLRADFPCSFFFLLSFQTSCVLVKIILLFAVLI